MLLVIDMTSVSHAGVSAINALVQALGARHIYEPDQTTGRTQIGWYSTATRTLYPTRLDAAASGEQLIYPAFISKQE